MLFTVQDVAKALKIGKNKVYELWRGGVIPFFKIGWLESSRKGLGEFFGKKEGGDFMGFLKISMFYRTNSAPIWHRNI